MLSASRTLLLRSSRRLPAASAGSNQAFVVNTRHLALLPDKVEYVHPLSQLVLEYLQTDRSDWIVSHGLDKGLTVHRDGTFLIKFPSYDKDMARIWTSYEPEEKKHWLTVHKGDLVGRFLLQDNLKPAWNDAASTPEKIQNAVDSLIEKIEEEVEETKEGSK
eukprot:CAMPEP_0119013684 /NCGR_PEP_ID=MMETSP1176-20130426/8747_1 /TAXON_ID=265551 /ORGANISM="Synedropsis recta cf, Strain CCMP1620" /LENGTH=161 /DNA_ID=CAMNT_0006966793 /DNA_START=18 /DNA_END=503 /DNA_ORIENTATION=-